MKILIPAAAAMLLCTASVSFAQEPKEKLERGRGQEKAAPQRSAPRPDAGNRGAGESRGRAEPRVQRERAEPRVQRERVEPRVQRDTPRADRAERRVDRPRERVQRDERPDRQAVERRERRDMSRERAARRGEDRVDERRQSERRQVERRQRDRTEPGVERERERVQAQDRRGRERPRAEGGGGGAQDRREAVREARTRLTADQRTRFYNSFDRRRVTNVRFSARIGTRIPRSVRLYVIPAAVISLVPVYSYYRYVYEDDIIYIVDPGSYEVIDVIEYGSGGPAVIEARLELTAAERAILLDSISADFPETEINLRLALGAEIPGRVELHTFPEVVVDRIPKLGGYRFVVSGGDVVIVGARSRDIALVVVRR